MANLRTIHPNLFLGNVKLAQANAWNEKIHSFCIAGDSTCSSYKKKRMQKFIMPDSKSLSYEKFVKIMEKASNKMADALNRGDIVMCHCSAGIRH